MSPFVGFVDFAGGAIDSRLEDQARRVIAAGNHKTLSIRRVPGALFAAAPEGVLSGASGRSLFVASARLDNRAELGAALGLSNAELLDTTDATLLLRMFERWAGAGVARCLGAFAFAYWDPDPRRLTLARDCLGHGTLLFHRAGNTVAFSNRLGVLLAMPQVPREIDELALANLLALNRRDAHRTAYRGIARTPSRSLVTIDRSGIRNSYYWSPDFDAPPPYAHDEDYVERARELFDQAVVSATAGAGEVAISVSGGLDSSAIAATVARLGHSRRIVCYTRLPPADLNVAVGSRQYRDERDKVESLARLYPMLDINFLTVEDSHPFDDDPTRYFAQGLLPRFGGMNLGLVGAMNDRLSKHPLALFGTRGNFGLTWTGEFSLRALLRAGHWATFARELPLVAGHGGRSVARTLMADVVKPALPSAMRRLWHRSRGRDPESVARYSALNPDFIRRNDLPRLWREQGFDPWMEPDGSDPARYRAWHLFDKTGVDRDNPDWASQSHGFDVRDPFADRRLIEFALAVPEPLYRRNGVPRSFARAVFADRLPREILQETRRGANNLGWLRRLDRRRPQIAAEIERMEASPTASRLIDIPRLKRLLDQWPKDEQAAQHRVGDYNAALARAVHVGSFIRWVEGGNG